MSKTIDEKVVEMRFDNRQFESNVQTTLNTLDKLKKNLNFEESAKSFEQLDAAAQKVDMNGLRNAAETVREKFSALEIIAVTALVNITNSAINAGKQLVASLTVDQITAGWDKFAKKTTSVATLISQGNSMETVEAQLERLNWFTDETSYNFTDMVDSISKFTASGQDLETSVSAMEGIANWAALSGQNAATASRAMYQLSQAMGAGVMRLEDYKSIQTANMDTAEFRQKCIDAALALGTLKKNADGTFTSIASRANKNAEAFSMAQFTTQLTNGAWLTSDVMMKVFNEYSAAVDQIYDYSNEKGITASQAIEELGDSVDSFGLKAFRAAQEAKTFSDAIDATKDAVSTGWMNTFELIFGNYEEQRVLWTDLANAMYDAFASGAEARNELLSEWNDLGGRDVLIESFWNAWEAVGRIITPIKEAFRDIFPATTAQQLLAITEKIRDLTNRLKISEETSNNLKNTFKGFFAVLSIVKSAISAVFNAISPLVGSLGNIGGKLLSVTGAFGEWLSKIDESIKKTNIFGKTIENVIGFFSRIGTTFRDFAETIRETFNLPDFTTIKKSLKEFLSVIKEKFALPGFELLHALLSKIHTRMSQVGDAAEKMKSRMTKVASDIASALTSCKAIELLQTIWILVKKIVSGIGTALGDTISNVMSKLKNADFKGTIDLLNSLSLGAIAVGVKKLLDTITEPIKHLGSIKNSVIGILDSVKGCFEAWQSDIKANTLLKIASAIAILAAAILVISLIDSEKLNSSLGAMTMLFVDLMGSMAIFNKISGKASGVAKTCSAMISMSIAIAILASSLRKVGELSWGQLAVGLTAIGGLMTMMVVTAKVLGSGGKAMVKGATQMLVFALAVKTLASVCKDLSSLSWDELFKGLTGVGILLAEVAAFLKLAEFSSKSVSTATGIFILAGAFKILASVCKDFASMSWEEMIKGLSGIGILLCEITAFTNLSGNAKHVLSTGLSLIAIAAAVKILGSALRDIGSLSWESISKGLLSITIALTGIAAIVNLVPKNMVGIGLGLIAVSTALLLLAAVLGKMGNMSWDEIARGLVALAGSIGLLALGLNAMTGTLSGSAALLIAVAALGVLTPVLAILGAMSWASIAKGLITIAGAFTIIGLAGLILKPIIPAILGLAASFVLVGIGTVAVGAGLIAAGAGLSALAIGFAALAGSLSVGATAIVVALRTIIMGIIGLIPAISVKIGEGIIALCNVIAEGVPVIAKAVKSIILSIVDVLVECVPPIVDGILLIVAEALKSLAAHTPQIVDSVFAFLIAILDGIAKNLPTLIVSVVNVVMAFFQGIIDALRGIDTDVLIKGIAGVGFLAALMLALSALASLVPSAMLGVLGMGALIAEIALVLAAVGALAQIPGLNWFITEGGKLLENIGVAIGSFIGGIVGGVLGGISSQFPKIGTDLSAFMTNAKPFIEGAKGVDSASLDGVKALAETILILTAANILDGLTSWLVGGSSLADFGEELVPFGESMKKFSKSISNIDGNLISNAATAGKALAEMAATLPNTGGVVSWFTGNNDMDVFGEQLVPFGEAMSDFSKSVKNIDSDAVVNATTAGKAIAELADTLPNTGGVVSWFTGNNDMDVFGEQLVPFGEAMKEYSDSISGINADAITNSTTAGKALAELATSLPNTGGVVSWFTGNNDMDDFGVKLVAFGTAMKKYSDSIFYINADAVTNSATAGKALAELSDTLPKTGGISSWFAGNKNLDDFGDKLVPFGESLTRFSSSVKNVKGKAIRDAVTAAQALSDFISATEDVKPSFDDFNMNDLTKQLIPFGEAMVGFSKVVTDLDVDSISKSVSAGKSVADLINSLPDTRDLISLISGVSNTDSFGEQLISFAAALKDYSLAIQGIDIGAVTNSSVAGKMMAELIASLPDTRDIKSLFTGISATESFTKNLVPFGEAMKGYSDAVDGMNSDAVVNSATVGKAIAELSNALPKTGGIISWFVGNNDMNAFGEQLVPFGEAIKKYSDAIEGIDTVAVNNSATAGKALAELISILPNTIDISSWFMGVGNTENFSRQLVPFGEAMKGYSDAVDGMNSDAVVNSATAGSALAELVRSLPNAGGTIDKIFGSSDLSTFGNQLVPFGEAMKNYSDAIDGIKIDAVANSATITKSIAELANNLPATGWLTSNSTLATFGVDLLSFGHNFKSYYDKVASINIDELSDVITETNKVIAMAKDMTDVDTSSMKEFGTSLRELGNMGVSEFVSGFTNATVKISDAALNMIRTFISSAESEQNNLVNAMYGLSTVCVSEFSNTQASFEKIGSDAVAKFILAARQEEPQVKMFFSAITENCIATIRDKYNSFVDAGKYLVSGFAKGISANTYLAINEAKKLAKKLAKNVDNAVREALGIHSPSRVGERLGEYFGGGFTAGLNNCQDAVTRASSGIGDSAQNGLTRVLARINDRIMNGIDAQPTIRPVLDLSAVHEQAKQLFRMTNNLNGYEISGSAQLANQTAFGMARREISVNQNGDSHTNVPSSNSSTVIENTFNITGNNPTEIANEVSRIIQKQVERRDASWA